MGSLRVTHALRMLLALSGSMVKISCGIPHCDGAAVQIGSIRGSKINMSFARTMLNDCSVELRREFGVIPPVIGLEGQFQERTFLCKILL